MGILFLTTQKKHETKQFQPTTHKHSQHGYIMIKQEK